MTRALRALSFFRPAPTTLHLEADMPSRHAWTVLLAFALVAPRPVDGASLCDSTSKGFVPLTDLGVGFYQGAQGGLYAGGVNVRPPAHDAAGVSIAQSIVPLDTLGNPDPANGRIVLISIGMSNCTQEFSSFVPKAVADPARNPSVLVIDCALGGQSADRIRNPDAAYWDSVATRLRGHGSSPLQAQVVWSKEANRQPTGGFPASADTLTWYMGSVVRNVRAKLPNVKLMYLTSRIYAGYASTPLNPEPYAYESGFAFKNLIAAQIAGAESLVYSPSTGAPQAPWLAWGPYLWADGLDARSDGLTWACADFSSTDGTHPSASGRNKVADSLLAFIHRDATTQPWYLAQTVSVSPPLPDLAFAVAPNPSSGAVEFAFTPREGEHWRIEIFDPAGRRVTDPMHGIGRGVREVRRWTPASLSAGLYWAVLSGDDGRRVRRFVRLAAR